MDYKKAGVDIEAGYKSVELMKEHVKKTMREEVLGGLGGFSGAFSLAKIKEMEEPVLLIWYRRLRNESKAGISSWTSMIPSVSTQLPCVSMILPAQAVSRYSSSTTLPAARTIRRRSQTS